MGQNRPRRECLEEATLREVGVYLDKSIDAVAAFFGAMKAGAAYVPVDGAELELDHGMLRMLVRDPETHGTLAVALEPLDDHRALTMGLGRNAGEIVTANDTPSGIVLEAMGLHFKKSND